MLQPKRWKIPQLGLHKSLPDLLRNGTMLTLTWLCTKASQTFTGTFSGTLLHLTWLCTKASQTFTFRGALCTKASHTFSRPGTLLNLTRPGCAPKPPRPSLEPMLFEPNLALHQSLPDLHLLRNPVEPDLKAGTLLNLTRLRSAPKPPQTFSGTFSGTLLNLTWLCTKASQTFTFSGTLLNLTRLDSAPKPPRPSLEPSPEPMLFEPDLAMHQSLPDLHLLRNPVEPDLALHQSLLDLLRNLLRNLVEPDQARVCPSLEPSPDPCWTWPGSAPKLNLTWLCTKASQTFSGTFSGTL